jgi:hypothetical protein
VPLAFHQILCLPSLCQPKLSVSSIVLPGTPWQTAATSVRPTTRPKGAVPMLFGRDPSGLLIKILGPPALLLYKIKNLTKLIETMRRFIYRFTHRRVVWTWERVDAGWEPWYRHVVCFFFLKFFLFIFSFHITRLSFFILNFLYLFPFLDFHFLFYFFFILVFFLVFSSFTF